MTTPHLTKEEVRAYSDGKPVSESVAQHLTGGCDHCHAELQTYFDGLLQRVEDRNDSLAFDAVVRSLGTRFHFRHFCPEMLIDDMMRSHRGSEVAWRHARHCPYCKREVIDIVENEVTLTEDFKSRAMTLKTDT